MRTRLLSGILLLAACSAPPEPAPAGRVSVSLNANPKSKVDLLFMVDNSNSMDAMQEVLRSGFFDFFAPFDDLAKNHHYVDFQIGVVTSDYGSGPTGSPGCSPSPGGQRGILQPLGAKAGPDCQPPMGERFIRYSNRPGGENNLPPGQDLATTFGCMASVGAMGCGFEHQLESVYAALHNQRENAGFIRPDAALAVAFLSNEDDASAPPTSPIFDKNQVPLYGYEDSYRQPRFGLVCCPPGKETCDLMDAIAPPYEDSGGKLKGCRPAPNPPGFEYDVRRYIDYFTRPAARGGAKVDPLDVLLYAIDAPDEPFQVILSNPGTQGGFPYQNCPQLNETSNPPCVPVFQHSCQNPDQPVLFGDPAIRLNTVVRSVAQHRLWSICDQDYGRALKTMATMVVSQLGAACLPAEQFASSNPALVDCVVTDVKADVDQEIAATIERCGTGGFPCWRIESKEACSGLAEGNAGLTIDRNGEIAPPDTYVRASCSPGG